VLTIQQPYAHLIFTGLKQVENRSWPTSYRGRLYIHAGKKIDREMIEEAAEAELKLPAKLVVSAILGHVEVTDCVPFDDLDPEWQDNYFVCGPFCFILEKPTLLAEPVPASGKLGIWRFKR
jgi:hypothetical protein